MKRSSNSDDAIIGSSTRIVSRGFHDVTKSSTFSSFIRSLLILVVHAVPFLGFLAIYGANRRLGFLPTDAHNQQVRLHNVTAWERIVLPLDPPIHRILSAAHHPILDVFAAVPYLAHYTLPVIGPLLLLVYFRRWDCACRFYLLLGVSMWTLYIVWYLLPTAPPWFYTREEAGNIVSGSTPSVSLDGGKRCREGVVFARVDRMFGISMFHQMFASNPVPFAAFPSGHVTWPTCLVLNLPVGTWKRLAFGGGYVALVAWATMYTTHHYFADVVGAILVVMVVDWSMASSVRWTADAVGSVHCTEEEGGKMELAKLGQVKISLPEAPCQSRYFLSRQSFILLM